MAKNSQQECFVIMPISEHKEYESGHFRRVYEDIIIPACEKAEYKAIRADEVEETDIIHLSILKKLIEAPMAICDLSSRNPNVLFELGLRQAFDKPVVLIQEKGTERIFDVSILRAYDYCKELKYKEVLEDQENIAKMLKGTEKSFVTGEGFNSVIKLLALSQSAQVKTIDDPNEQFKLQLYQLSSQMNDISSELRYYRTSENKKLKDISYDQIMLNEFSKERFIFDYEEFLYHYNRNNYDEMIQVYNKIKQYPIRSTKDKELLFDMRNRIKELDENRKMNPNT